MDVNADHPVSFAEIPFRMESEPPHPQEERFQPAAVVRAGSASIAFSNGADPGLVSGIIGEVLRHA